MAGDELVGLSVGSLCCCCVTMETAAADRTCCCVMNQLKGANLVSYLHMTTNQCCMYTMYM